MGLSQTRISCIIPVLNSHEVIRRQQMCLTSALSANNRSVYWELIIVDDGSSPSIPKCGNGNTTVVYVQTNDRRNWTQPRARNVGASVATGDWLVLIDVDHILLPECIEACEAFASQTEYDYMHFRRRIAALDENGGPITDPSELAAPPWNKPINEPLERKPSPSACMVRADTYRQIGGYDERFCGRYGSDDGDFNRRYWRASGKEPYRTPAALGLFPNMKDPAWFHGLDRVKGEPKQDQPVEPVLGAVQ